MLGLSDQHKPDSLGTEGKDTVGLKRLGHILNVFTEVKCSVTN